MAWLTLSKPRRIQWMILGGVFGVLWLSLTIISNAPFSFMTGLYLVMLLAFFGFCKFLDTEDKQTRYEKVGYEYLTTTEKGETVLTYTSPSSKPSPNHAVLLAVFDQDGYLIRQTRVFQKDVELVAVWLKKHEDKHKER